MKVEEILKTQAAIERHLREIRDQCVNSAYANGYGDPNLVPVDTIRRNVNKLVVALASQASATQKGKQ